MLQKLFQSTDRNNWRNVERSASHSSVWSWDLVVSTSSRAQWSSESLREYRARGFHQVSRVMSWPGNCSKLPNKNSLLILSTDQTVIPDEKIYKKMLTQQRPVGEQTDCFNELGAIRNKTTTTTTANGDGKMDDGRNSSCEFEAYWIEHKCWLQ